MKKDDFYIQIKQVLELYENKVNGRTTIHLSSLQTLAVIAFADEKFRKRVKISDLREVKTISDLMTVLGAENFTE